MADKNKHKRSSTRERQQSFYLTPQNETRVKEAVTSPLDGKKKISKNGLVNKALDYFFKSGQASML